MKSIQTALLISIWIAVLPGLANSQESKTEDRDTRKRSATRAGEITIQLEKARERRSQSRAPRRLEKWIPAVPTARAAKKIRSKMPVQMHVGELSPGFQSFMQEGKTDGYTTPVLPTEIITPNEKEIR